MAKKVSKRALRELTEEDLGIKAVNAVDRPRSWCIYGRSGSGKTTFAGTFPSPILLLDIKDQGTDSVADVKGLKVMEIDEWDDIEDIYDFLYANRKKYKTVVFDTITQLQQLCLEHLVKDDKRNKGRVGDWGTLTRRQWGDASAMMKEKITAFRDLGLECVFLAQERTTHDDDDQADDAMLVPEVGPANMKSVASHLCASVSIIGHTFIEIKRTTKEVKGKKVKRSEPQYKLGLGPHPIYSRKIRKPRGVIPPDAIADPTYDDVIDVIKGN